MLIERRLSRWEPLHATYSSGRPTLRRSDTHFGHLGLDALAHQGFDGALSRGRRLKVHEPVPWNINKKVKKKNFFISKIEMFKKKKKVSSSEFYFH